ncbi:uncharacterized protein CEXT_803901 [Caerostris extrusa]|uniref:Uncharacterized protein n=1 Tax=Caerostris extrusa TaxID=172846 RepID=A0AAV4Y309_CAEEX|nr:uncharacterized protein CEXT_803901 [Caerostris extrusa]
MLCRHPPLRGAALRSTPPHITDCRPTVGRSGNPANSQISPPICEREKGRRRRRSRRYRCDEHRSPPRSFLSHQEPHRQQQQGGEPRSVLQGLPPLLHPPLHVLYPHQPLHPLYRLDDLHPSPQARHHPREGGSDVDETENSSRTSPGVEGEDDEGRGRFREDDLEDEDRDEVTSSKGSHHALDSDTENVGHHGGKSNLFRFDFEKKCVHNLCFYP